MALCYQPHHHEIDEAIERDCSTSESPKQFERQMYISSHHHTNDGQITKMETKVKVRDSDNQTFWIMRGTFKDVLDQASNKDKIYNVLGSLVNKSLQLPLKNMRIS